MGALGTLKRKIPGFDESFSEKCYSNKITISDEN